VNDAIRSGSSGAKAAKVVEGTTMHLSASSRQRGSGLVRTSKAYDLVTSSKQLSYDERADVSGRPSNKYTHIFSSSNLRYYDV
jgi:hypothetical protein